MNLVSVMTEVKMLVVPKRMHKWQHILGVIIPVDSNHLEYFLLDSLHAIVIITVHITFYLMKYGF